MKAQILFLFILLTIGLGYSQNQPINEFKLDSIRHFHYVEDILKKIDNKNVIQFSDLNFASNDTYLFWLQNGELNARFISNKKAKKRFKNKRIRIGAIEEKKIIKLFQKNLDFEFLRGFNDCKSQFFHSYNIVIKIDNKDYKINSNCISTLKKNELIGVLFDIAD